MNFKSLFFSFLLAIILKTNLLANSLEKKAQLNQDGTAITENNTEELLLDSNKIKSELSSANSKNIDEKNANSIKNSSNNKKNSKTSKTNNKNNHKKTQPQKEEQKNNQIKEEKSNITNKKIIEDFGTINNFDDNFDKNEKNFDNDSQEIPFIITSNIRNKENFHIPAILVQKDIIDSLFLTVKNGDNSAFYELYKLINNPNIKSDNQETILTFATLYKRHEIMIALLFRGANPNMVNGFDYSPIDIAIENEDGDALEILLVNYADINYQDKNGNSHLMNAILKNNLNIVKILVKNGAEIGLKNYQNINALNLAKQIGSEEIYNFLISQN